MFVSQAHSFAQQARLAITLAWVAGYTNILTILMCHQVTSHASGTTSNLGEFLSQGDWERALYPFFLLTTFFLGAALSGACTEFGRRRGWESIYVLPIIIEALLLLVFANAALIHGPGLAGQGAILYWLTGAAAGAMGLQNATITRISSGAVRTTHVTGVLTDLGLEAAQYIWQRCEHRSADDPPQAHPHHGGQYRDKLSGRPRPTWRRLLVLASVIGSFALGAGLGTIAHSRIPYYAMFPPVAFLLWIIYQDMVRPIAEIEALDLDDDTMGLELPDSLAVYHLGKDHDRDGKIHRMPNLLAWADRLSPKTQVIILDLGEAAPLDENAAMELLAVLNRLAPQGRHLIVAGIGADQYRKLRVISAGDVLRLDNVCPDLELAIARGLTIIHDLHHPNVPHGLAS